MSTLTPFQARVACERFYPLFGDAVTYFTCFDFTLPWAGADKRYKNWNFSTWLCRSAAIFAWFGYLWSVIKHVRENAGNVLKFNWVKRSILRRASDSSVGRAVDCSWKRAVIHRSLVQIRLEGVKFFCFSNKFCWSTSSPLLQFAWA